MVLMHSAHQPNPKDSVWCQFEPDRTKFELNFWIFAVFFYCFWTCNMFVSAVSPFFNRFCPFFDTKSFSVGCLSLWVNWVISEILKSVKSEKWISWNPKKKVGTRRFFFFVFAFLAPFWMPQVISVDIPMGFFRFGEILNFWYFWSMEPHRRRNGIFSAGNSHNCTHIYPY